MSLTQLKHEAALLPIEEQRDLLAFLVTMQVDRTGGKEEEPLVLAALDEAIAQADGDLGISVDDLRQRLDSWISR